MTPTKKSIKKSANAKAKKKTVGKENQLSALFLSDPAASAERSQLSTASEEGHGLFEVILRSASDGILAVNRENQVLFANERFVEMWRIPQEIMVTRDDDLLLQSVLDQLSNPQDFLQKVQELYRSFEESFDTLYFKDGRVFERLSRPMLQGTNLLGRVWSFRDVTERKQAEEALAKEQYEMQLIMNNLPSGIYFKDQTSRFTRISKFLASRFNLSDPAQAIGKTDFDFFTEEHAQQAYTDEQEIIRTGQPVYKEEKETWANRPEIWVLTAKMPIRDPHGNIIGTFGISTDITERKQAEMELNHVMEALETANRELKQSLEREKMLACTDGLTGLSNHRYLFDQAAREFEAAIRYRRPLAFLMFDIDHFKRVNDSLGHTVGNEVLVKVAQTAVACVRASDIVARYGGDEFMVVLPNTIAQDALPAAERLRTSMAAIQVEMGDEPFTITLSIGIAELRREPLDKNVEQVIQRADEALYQAKHGGRNCVVIFGQGESRLQ